MSQTSAPKLALTRDEAADALSTSKDRIDKAIRSGELRAKKVGRTVRIKWADLDAWYESHPDA